MATRRGFLGTVTAAGAATLLTQTQAATSASAAPAATDEKAARDAIRNVNAGMRANYASLKSELIKHLSPVIVVQNNAVGGRFTLINNGVRVETVDPVPEYFELAKSIAHIPLGIYSVIAAYLSDQVPNIPNAERIDPHDLDMVAFKTPGDKGWTTPLSSYRTTLNSALTMLPTANLPDDLDASCTTILTEAVKFIDTIVKAAAFDMVAFNRFAATVYPSIRVNMTFAATAQITGIEALMKRWRALIGEQAWSDLYVTVLSIWTTSDLNQASIIIRRTMNQAKVATHLIDLPTVETPSDPIAVALDNLARIVQDNVAAEMVFNTDLKVADALKGKEDLLSDEILKQIGGTAPTADTAAFSAAAAATCPITGHTAAV
ncbi:MULTISPECIES: hypothetical protein [Streptomyces]|uniref:hypothetical protein n=1 Tax=Streptomyces TaxID=1883 RepID=UPI00073DF3CE|nr:hypothetical protein [Streptomyces sp. EAS-AB2608]BCM64697.1 hypothetical protein EASAB2608_00031 [Streptomyces sp. EAS-AB2608]BCM72992.1 hypothetical protein EASAB2608_08326 [Streptomyces sp. EAS-AB2608]CUW33225.1 hypothetical protein TUE45_pSRTUE45c_0593 [Streptomyces reticuli]